MGQLSPSDLFHQREFPHCGKKSLQLHISRLVEGYINVSLYFRNQMHVTAVKWDYMSNPNVCSGWFSTAFGSVVCEYDKYTFSII